VPISSGLQGARVLVTAASQGIGYAAAEAFLGEGARVVVNSLNAARLESAVDRLRELGDVHGIMGDLTRQADLDRLVEGTVQRFGGLDTLVYLAGSPRPGTFMEQGFEDWTRAAALMVVSPAYLARKVAEAMQAGRTAGRMVFLGSVAMREPIPNLATSSVCRIAVGGLVRTLARELGPTGIRVNGILPGYIRTSRVDDLAADSARRRGVPEAQVLREMELDVPLGRIGSPQELARAIVFLGSEMSSYVTGTLLTVDGGRLRSVG
jgi:3-oxoacyl-[acyl-carrier protein] reductase